MTDRGELRQRMRQQFSWRTDRSIDFSLANMDGWWDDPSVVESLGPMLADLFVGQRATVIMAPAASGLQLGPLVAAHLALRFVAVRKDPGSSIASDRWTSVTTPPDYRDRHQVLGWRASRVRAGDRVLVVDDVVETGAQLAAIHSGVQQSGATWVGAAVLIDMLSSNARRRKLGVRAVFKQQRPALSQSRSGLYHRNLRAQKRAELLCRRVRLRRGQPDDRVEIAAPWSRCGLRPACSWLHNKRPT